MIWMEMRCDLQMMDAGQPCWSHANKGPKLGSEHPRPTLSANITLLERQARALGWKRMAGGWACPICGADLPIRAKGARWRR
jgi:hypothetical protein